RNQGGFGQGGGFGAGTPAQQPPAPRRGDRPLTPPPGAPRAELPGGGAPQRPQAASWGNEQAAQDGPRGHEEIEQHTGQYPRPQLDDRQGPGSTAEFARPDFDGPPPGQDTSSTGQFVRPDVFGAPQGAQSPSNTGQYERPGAYGQPTGQHTGQNAAQNNGLGTGQNTGQYARPPMDDRQGPGATSEFARPDFDAPRAPQQPQQPQPQQYQAPQQPRQNQGQQRPAAGNPQQSQPEALPPAPNAGDGRTPLYDTLETNWFHGQGGQQGGQNGQQPGQPAPGAQGQGNQGQAGRGGPQQGGPRPAQSPAAAPQSAERRPAPVQRDANGAAGNGSWRPSPNDELVRQAERARKPAAGGVTTSGLPKRVPRANLVAGTAQQQQNQAGPQVSRAPDDVRGRLTNLRRGIQQGRQAGNGPSTGSFSMDPTHQQER
ncbi:hypothetical protein ACFVYD_32770, partial [Streptomyces sp. NPDC058301]